MSALPPLPPLTYCPGWEEQRDAANAHHLAIKTIALHVEEYLTVRPDGTGPAPSAGFDAVIPASLNRVSGMMDDV